MGCGDRDPQMLFASANSLGDGPDEFAVVPQKPLVDPPDYVSLPSPAPGSPNLADLQPETDAVAALGGRLRTAGPVAGPALISHTTRFGVSPNIRATLAQEDAEFRRRNRARPLERWFSVNVYFKAYSAMALNQHREAVRLQSFGIPTAFPPPEPQ